MPDQLLEFMRSVYLFQGLPDTALQRVYDCGRESRYATNDVLVECGRVHDRLYLVVSGTVEVVLPDMSNVTRPLKLTTCGTGAVIGEMSMVDPQTSQSVVWAKSDVRAFVIEYACLNEILADDPAIAARMLRNQLRTLVSRLRADVSELLSYRNAAA